MTKAMINTVTISKADIPSGGMKSYKQEDDSIILWQVSACGCRFGQRSALRQPSRLSLASCKF